MSIPTYTWKKLGRIFLPSGRHPRLLTHAANPLPMHLSEDIYRIFYSGRDERNRSSVGAFDFDIERLCLVEDHIAPFFCAGPEGSFYEYGVSIGNCYRVGEEVFMLFMGWQNPKDSHWFGEIGRLVVHSDLTLSLKDDRPLITCAEFDTISLSYPWAQALVPEGYEMWYGATETWEAGNNEMLHVLKHAISSDGHNWQRTEQMVPFEIGIAQAFSRPTVLNNPDGTKDMWFSFRSGDGTAYRIGHSHISGGTWSQPARQSGLDVSPDGWDNEMTEYPFVFEHKGKVFMLYNGNGYGKTGIGLAELQR